MARWIACGVLVFASATLGCGGTSESALKNRYAQRRSAPDKDDPAAVPAQPANTVAPAAGKAPSQAAVPAALAPAVTKSEEAPRVRQQLTVEERRARSIANLEAIGNAIVAYTAKHGHMPPVAILDDDGNPMLSWRVAILPELGYQELFDQFRRTVPWYNVHNRALLAQIPAEFRSPERQDTKTNYLGVSGEGMALGDFGGLKLAGLKDGADNTLAVVEVDERLAQEWTQPVEFVPNAADPRDGLGILRTDGAFGVMASGRSVLVPRKLPREQWAALFTPAGGEIIDASVLSAPPPEKQSAESLALTIAPAPSAPAAQATATSPAVSVAASVAGTNVPPPSLAAPGAAAAPLATAVYPVHGLAKADDSKLRVPDKDSLLKARNLLKEVYKDDYEKAQTSQQRQEFAKKLLADAPKVNDNPEDLYELLRIAGDVAASVGDVTSVLSASEAMQARFNVDALVTRLKALQELERFAKSVAAPETAHKEALKLKQDAFAADRFDVAVPAQELALAFKRIEAGRQSAKEREFKAELTRLQREVASLQKAKEQYEAVKQSLAALRSEAADQAANEVVGKYLCFVKNQWDAGLPFLARSADIKLRVMSTIDTTTTRTAAELISLGNQYWEMAERTEEPQRRGLRLRAAHCYTLASAEAPKSLEKIMITRRIEEVGKDYGSELLTGTTRSAPSTALD